jgi:hypothetical protein
MFERARQLVHRLLGGNGAPPSDAVKESKTHNHNGQGPSSRSNVAFRRFLRDYKAHIAEEFEDEHVKRHRPRTFDPPDSPSAPTRR